MQYTRQGHLIPRYYKNLILLFLLCSCYTSAPQQNGKDVYQDGKLPALAELIANPRPKDEDASGKVFDLDVAVIDSGVDYLHPQLKSQIKFIKNVKGEWTTGIDLEGNDAWPHPNYADNAIFAFGAEIENGKISQHLNDPVATLDSVNTDFISFVKNRLKGSHDHHFKKIYNKLDSLLHILGARYLYINQEDLLEKYNQEFKNDSLWKIGDELQSQFPSSHIQYYYLDRGEFSMDSNGIPYNPARPLYSIKGFNTFLILVVNAYKDFETQIDFTRKYLKPYFEFRVQEDQSLFKETQSDRELKLGIELLGRWKNRYQINFLSTNDLLASAGNYCENYLSLNQISSFKNYSVSTKHDVIKASLKNILDDVIKYNDVIASSTTATIELRSKADKQKVKIQRLRAEYNTLLERKDILDKFDCDKYLRSSLSRSHSSPYLDYFREIGNPYLNFYYSKRNSHGTHVSGIIAMQDDGIGIVPVRVLTTPSFNSKNQEAELSSRYQSEIINWLRSPLVSRALAIHYGDRNSELIVQYFKENFDLIFSNFKLNFYFLESILKAIHYVGESKIKIANISLGTESSLEVHSTKATEEKGLQEQSDQLLIEFFKFKVGKKVLAVASSTVFVIAAGNGSGEWVDSEVKNAIPCDISSPFIRVAENSKTGLVAPNNKVDNIVCVLSSRADGKLSPFTKVPLSPIPKVIVRGENVRSYMRSKWDCTGTDQTMREEFGELPFPSLYSESQLVSEMSGVTRKGAAHDIQREKILTAFQVFEALRAEISFSRCINSTSSAANMSGTSMAAPTVSGHLAHKLISKLKNDGLTQKESYNNLNYSPKVLIAEFLNSCIRFGGNSDLAHYPYIPETEICRLATDPMSEIAKNRKLK